ncbi:carbohydrate-binding family 9-like protein [soil metagenome]
MSTPKQYVCYRAPSELVLDGGLDKPFWADAPWSDDFVDIEGDAKPKPRFRTRAKMLWDDKHLYIGAELEEPHVWGTLTQHDSVIFNDNDFEVFLDPDGDGALYSELEMNALNTTWDLLLVRAYMGGGPAIDGWELHGLRTAVQVEGSLNDPSDKDKGWSVEIAIPFLALKDIAGCPCPPRDGDLWRINFSRVEWHHEVADGRYQRVAGTREDNWVWSPQGVVDMHRPEKWGVLQFSHHDQGPIPAHPLQGQREREMLVRVFDAQRTYREAHGRWATSSVELGIAEAGIHLECTTHLFEASYGGYKIDASRRFYRS